jgi:uncharacterized protein (DUF1800 family)
MAISPPAPLRTRRRPLLVLDPRAAGAEPLGGPPPSMAVLALNRLGFGPRPGDIAAFNALGASDDARLAAYVAQQLWPGPDSQDTEYWNRRNGLAGHPNPGFTTLGLSLQQLWQTYRTGGVSPSSRPVQEVRLDTLLRMVHSRWQLREVLVDFWMNHFNVYGFETYTQETFVHWNRDVIRAHAFGNFRTLLEAVARSTTMLYYLDNYTNTRSGPNENWARELFELHTLGAENYLGVGDPTQVPAGAPWPAGSPWPGQPAPAGYVDNDVYEAARCFTGWGVDGVTGQFLYTDSNHDRFSKSVLHFGVLNVPADQGPEVDGEQVLDLLAHHPGTARHLARKLCRRFVADEPSQPLVDQVATAFLDLVDSPDQIRTVLATLFDTPEFKDSWGAKIKRPVEWSVSTLRATNGVWLFGFTAQDPLTTESDTSNFLSRQSRTGQSLFSRVPPDGYPDRREAWASSNTRVQCWRLAGWLLDQRDESRPGDPYRCDVVGITLASLPAGQRSSDQIVDFWLQRILGRPIDLVDRGEIVDMLAAGASPSTQLDLTASSVASRLRSTVALILMTPEFFLK